MLGLDSWGVRALLCASRNTRLSRLSIAYLKRSYCYLQCGPNRPRTVSTHIEPIGWTQLWARHPISVTVEVIARQELSILDASIPAVPIAQSIQVLQSRLILEAF